MLNETAANRGEVVVARAFAPQGLVLPPPGRPPPVKEAGRVGRMSVINLVRPYIHDSGT